MYNDPDTPRPLRLKFEVPIGLPNLGEVWSRPCRSLDLDSLVVVRQIKTPGEYQSRFGGMKIEGPGHSYHERDRFGVYSYSAIEICMLASANDLFDRAVLAVLGLSEVPGAPPGVGIPHLAEAARVLASSVFNSLVDAHSIAFGTYWIPHITPEDIFHLKLVEDTPAGGIVQASAMGIDGHGWRFGLQENYASTDANALGDVFKVMPLTM